MPPDPERSRPGSRALVEGTVAAVYGLLAVASTWPLALHLSDTLPKGTGGSATVPLVSAWALWWTADRVASGFVGFWDAPIFHPVGDAFAFSETIVLGGILSAPVQWLGGSPALAHNLFLLLSLMLNGWLAYRLLRALRLEPWVAGLGGAVVLMLPYVHYELGVLTLVPTWGITWMLLALKRVAERPGPAAGLQLGLASAATALLCAHYALFAALVVGPAALVLFGRRIGTAPVLRALGVSALAAGLLAGPLVWAQLAAADAHGFERTLERVRMGAASPASWLTVPWRQLLNPPFVLESDDPERMALFPGTVKLLLGSAGLVLAGLAGRRRRFAAFLAAIGIAGLVLSTAARIEIGGLHPYDAVKAWIPGLGMARSLWRAGLFVQLVLGLGTALVLQAGVDATRRAGGPVARHRAALAALGLAGSLAVVEVWPVRQALAPVPQATEYAGLRRWLDGNAPPARALLPLPQPEVPRVDRFEPTARWMYATPFHGRPLAVGYASFVPRRSLRLVRQSGGCPTADAYGRLARRPLLLAAEAAWLDERPECAPPATSWQPVHDDRTLGLRIYQPSVTAGEADR